MRKIRKFGHYMEKNAWNRKVKKLMREAGTYEKHFEPAISALAEILEQRDHAYEEYMESGARLLVEKVSDRGAVNMVKNPLLQVWNDMNTTALSYWRDLGLTPAGLKRINEAAMQKKPENGSVLETALLRLADGS